MNAVYTALDDLPCESHKEDYILRIPLTPEAQFTTALLFFNQEVVFAWYNGRVYVDRIPNDFVVNFKTELGARYCQNVEDELEVQEEHFEIPVDTWEVTLEERESFSKLSKQAQREIRNEINRQRIDEMKQRAADEAMANRHHVQYQEQSWTRTKEEQQLIDVKQQAFERAMAER